MNRQTVDIVTEELNHIPRGSDKQNWFRATYNMVRRHDLARNHNTERRDSFLKAITDMKRSFKDFDPIFLDYHVAYFVPVPLDPEKQLASKERLSIIEKREQILKEWAKFAEENNLHLNWTSNNPIFRATLVMEHNGGCPAYSYLPKDRPFCPCPECIQECKEMGECADRVFLRASGLT